MADSKTCRVSFQGDSIDLARHDRAVLMGQVGKMRRGEEVDREVALTE